MKILPPDDLAYLAGARYNVESDGEAGVYPDDITKLRDVGETVER